MKIYRVAAVAAVGCSVMHAAVIGTNRGAESISAERIERLAPAKGQGCVAGLSAAVSGADAGGPGCAGGGVEAG